MIEVSNIKGFLGYLVSRLHSWKRLAQANTEAMQSKESIYLALFMKPHYYHCQTHTISPRPIPEDAM